MLANSILFITIFGGRVGYGHLNRCKNLSEYFLDAGYEVKTILFSENKNRNTHSIDAEIYDVEEIESRLNFCNHLKYKYVVVDLIYQDFFRDILDPVALLTKAQQFGKISIFIDSLGSNSIAETILNFKADYLLIPYVCNLNIDSGRYRKILAGSRYAILGKEYKSQKLKIIKKEITNILILAGGSDVSEDSLNIILGIRALGIRNDNFTIRVIIGPLFSVELREKLFFHSARDDIKLEFIESPESLHNHMQWADIAISASGLTKYELAACGVPMLLYSIDKFHYCVNKPFIISSGAVDLGIHPPPNLVADELLKIIDNVEVRKSMSLKSQGLVDGCGVKRLLDELEGGLL
ncbi:hypothetical protein ICN35_08665 [Polynucleobacter sp. es-GGE-1]|uniref:hypothetical protein n=1 Tax=Polynucleobacter sp. es-GGE-1 TaxID=1819724 RepID=UPI001C0BC075|nr:hypothetical protein [Polynucleobacter sp. es-GGE-1]MBU3635530.1 hypothetical protein [Polynucleobacter sp. es-GGE-1]